MFWRHASQLEAWENSVEVTDGLESMFYRELRAHEL